METSVKAYEDLARIAVFFEQARLDEVTYEPEHKRYKRHYQVIEEESIYWLLCQLQKFIHEMGQDEVNVRVTREVMSVQLRTTSDRAMRHNRDYILLRDTESVFRRIEHQFETLHEKLLGAR